MIAKPFHRRLIAILAVGLLLPAPGHAGLLESLFAPKPDLWPRWSAHDASDTRRIEHTAWDAFLRRHAADDGTGVVRIAYGRVSDQDRASLQAYIDGLAAVPISGYARQQQFAYWVNMYNALTVLTVLQHYPVQSIRDIDISPGLFSDGPWGRELVEIEGEVVSLDDIEHRILRPIWQDPRVHYAVNCASIGCPNLQLTAFTAENTESLLTQGARAFVNHPRGARIGADGPIVSSLYAWFEEDFDADGGVLAHLRRYARPEFAERLEAFEEAADFEYDWTLNDVAPSEE